MELLVNIAFQVAVAAAVIVTLGIPKLKDVAIYLGLGIAITVVGALLALLMGINIYDFLSLRESGFITGIFTSSGYGLLIVSVMGLAKGCFNLFITKLAR